MVFFLFAGSWLNNGKFKKKTTAGLYRPEFSDNMSFIAFVEFLGFLRIRPLWFFRVVPPKEHLPVKLLRYTHGLYPRLVIS